MLHKGFHPFHVNSPNYLSRTCTAPLLYFIPPYYCPPPPSFTMLRNDAMYAAFPVEASP